MRDGVELCTNVFRPAANGRVPALLVRTPYGKGQTLSATYASFLAAGYAVVIQDVRGRGHSTGVFWPYYQEVDDGDDTLDWIAAQPWCSGRIGMVGASYLGIVQWKAALSRNPHLKAISPAVSGCDDFEDRFYSKGGAIKLGHRLQWMAENMRAPGFRLPELAKFIFNLPLRTSDLAATGQRSEMYQASLDHPTYDSFWKAISTREQIGRVDIPVLSFGGWYDNYAENDLEAFRRLRALSRDAHVVIGPWAHSLPSTFPGFDFGPEANLAIRRMQLEFFDRWLKPPDPARKATFEAPPARLFVMGVNHWKDEQEWPPRNSPTHLYLSSGGHLLANPPASGKPDEFVYDPRKPVPTVGGAVCCNPKIIPWGPVDQQTVEKRRDVLVYTGSPLKSDTEVTGVIRVVVWAATSVRDTDFTAKLVDVHPNGLAVNLCDGILRMRYREGLERNVTSEPGQIYRLVIEAGVTSNVFRKGHKIRLEISSSNFPRFDRNPNTGRPIADEKQLRVARQSVYHDARHPSHVLLPVLGD
jgi:putative CocE/NonD family hydrolase